MRKTLTLFIASLLAMPNFAKMTKRAPLSGISENWDILINGQLCSRAMDWCPKMRMMP